MRIDFHSHFIPERAVQAASSGKPWHGILMSRTHTGALAGQHGGEEFDLPEWSGGPCDLATRIAWLDAHRLDAQVVSIAPRLQRYLADASHAVPVARDMNDDLAALVRAAPDRFYGLVHLPLQDPDAAVAELRRMAGQPGIIGAAVGTNVDGAPWSDPALFPVLAAVQDAGMVLFVHPANRPDDPRMKRYHLNNLVGNPLETTLAVAAFILGGVLDRLTDLRLCFAHAGGFAALGIGRFDAGYAARSDVRAGCTHAPSSYMGRLYFDSLTFSDRALRHVVDVAGISQVVMGSDYPADMGAPDPVGFVEGCKSLSRAEKDAILGANALRLIRRE
jgi:aminocarboxymuconate-semialdehyde decarboxylase